MRPHFSACINHNEVLAGLAKSSYPELGNGKKMGGKKMKNFSSKERRSIPARRLEDIGLKTLGAFTTLREWAT
jgi:hypothetical protein